VVDAKEDCTLMPSRVTNDAAPMGNAVIPIPNVERSIHVLRGQRVMIDGDLARLYGVETKALNRAVKRNLSRFPEDFMFRITVEEEAGLRCQIGTSNRRGGRRYLPYAFTEHGVAMLSSVLNSKRAIAVNIEIMRVFGMLRKFVAARADLTKRLTLLEAEMAKNSAEFGHHKAETVRALKVVFETLRALAAQRSEPEPKREPIGFTLHPRK
jgi:hypothetical protein